MFKFYNHSVAKYSITFLQVSFQDKAMIKFSNDKDLQMPFPFSTQRIK